MRVYFLCSCDDLRVALAVIQSMPIRSPVHDRVLNGVLAEKHFLIAVTLWGLRNEHSCDAVANLVLGALLLYGVGCMAAHPGCLVV